jgi:1,4-dihydroxy-2-naphthoate octaprenyltransferase
MLSKLWAFIKLGRLHFLGAGFLLHALGASVAWAGGAPFNGPVYAWTQLAITATQLMTHYANEYFDLAADRANRTPTRWSGGSRILPFSALPPRVALYTSIVLMAVALCAAIVLAAVIQTGALTLPLLLLALALAWFYSAPPIRLHSRGLGELAAAFVVTGLTPLVGYYTQAGRLELLPFLAAAPLVCLQFAMLIAINFPDAAGDAEAGKRTLVVRLGGRAGAFLRSAAVILAYLLLPVLTAQGLPLLAAIAFLPLTPLALWQVWRMARADWARPSRWNSLAFWSVAHLIGAIVLELGAFAFMLAQRTRL